MSKRTELIVLRFVVGVAVAMVSDWARTRMSEFVAECNHMVEHMHEGYVERRRHGQKRFMSKCNKEK